MGSDQQFCLRWNNHQNTLVSIFDNLLESGTLVDCTLAAEGRSLQAHKVVLSACSPYFAMLLREHQDKFPILILKDIKFQELQAMMNYMYRGEVNITQEQLGSFLKAAESLQIRGLTDSGVENNNIFRDAGTTHSFHTNKKVPDSRKIVIPPTTVSQSRSPPVINTPQPKKYLKPPPPPALPAPPTENHHYNRSSATNNDLDTVSSPNIKRRKLLPPIKSEGLVVTPINPSPYNHIDANTCDVPSQLQSIPASEAKANVPSPSIPSSLESTQTDIIPVIKSEPSSGNGKSKSSVVETVKIKVEHSDEMYNNNDDTNDGSYTADENAESDSKDENHLGMPPGYEQSRSTNFDNLSDRSIGHDSNSALQDSQVFEEADYEFFEANFFRYNLTDNRNYKCSKCNKMYRYKCTLQRHITYECGKQPNFHCPYCPVSMKRKSNLLSHIAAKHSLLL